MLALRKQTVASGRRHLLRSLLEDLRAAVTRSSQTQWDALLRAASDATTKRQGFLYASEIRVATWDVAAAIQKILRANANAPALQILALVEIELLEGRS